MMTKFSATVAAMMCLYLASACKREPATEGNDEGRGDKKSTARGGGSVGPISALSSGGGQVNNSLLVGTWVRTPDGSPGDIAADYRFTTHYKEDGSLEFAMQIEGEEVVSGEGVWAIEIGKLRSTITASSDSEVAEPGTEVSVDVLKLTKDSLRYRARGQAAITETRVAE
jgi:hypothetical protein